MFNMPPFTVNEMPALKVILEFAVIVPELTVTPPAVGKVAGHSGPVVNAPGLLY